MLESCLVRSSETELMEDEIELVFKKHVFEKQNQTINIECPAHSKY